MKFPKNIEAGSVSTRTIGSIDLLPTLCYLADIPLPENEIDGKNVWDLISGTEGAENPHFYYAFSNSDKFEGVISGDGRWKLHLPHPYRALDSAGSGGFPGRYAILGIDTTLSDMEADPFETTNVLADFPEVESRLTSPAEKHQERFYRENYRYWKP